jgi:lysozyme
VIIVDLSNNNPSVDFERLARVPGLVGVYLKASEGETYRDRTFAERRRQANAAGLRVGAYHYARRRDPAAEAANFVGAVGGELGRRDLRPVLDAEDPRTAGHAWDPWARAWNAAVRRRLGVWPGFYSYPWWIGQLRARTPIGGFLWLASYGRNDGTEHPYRVPAPWKRAALHQFSSRARVAGVAGECDLSTVTRRLWPLLAHPIRGRL